MCINPISYGLSYSVAPTGAGGGGPEADVEIMVDLGILVPRKFLSSQKLFREIAELSLSPSQAGLS